WDAGTHRPVGTDWPAAPRFSSKDTRIGRRPRAGNLTFSTASLPFLCPPVVKIIHWFCVPSRSICMLFPKCLPGLLLLGMFAGLLIVTGGRQQPSNSEGETGVYTKQVTVAVGGMT